MINKDEVPIVPLSPPDGTFIGKMYMMPDFSSWKFSDNNINNNVEKDI